MKTLLLSAAILTLGSGIAYAEETGNNSPVTKAQEYQAVPEKNFTGEAEFGSFFQSGEYNDYKGAIVNFDAGTRTNWHTHPKGQTLVITDGKGRVQIEGQAVQIVKEGDTVWFPADVRHWHGGGIDTKMSHVAIHSPNENGEVVEWMEAVDEADYLSGKDIE